MQTPIFTFNLRSSCWIVVILISALLSGCIGTGSFHGKSLSGVGDNSPVLSDYPTLHRIVVIGGTSGIGLEVVKLSLNRGHLVTAVARRPERMPITDPKLTTLKGDITDIDSMMNIVAGHHLVVSAVGIAVTSKKVTVFSEGIKNVIAAMNKNKVERLLTITAVGAGDSEGHGSLIYNAILQPLVLSTDIDDKTAQEVIVAQSNTNWTIVRPAYLTNDPPSHNYRVLTELEGIKTGKIARSDVAHFIVASFEGELYSKQAIVLTN